MQLDEIWQLLEQSAPLSQLIEVLNELEESDFEQLGEALSQLGPQERFHAVQVLSEAGNPEAMAALEFLFEDPEEEIRARALEGYYEFGSDEAQLERLGRLLQADPSERVRCSAVLALAVTGQPEARRLLEGAAEEDPFPSVRRQAQQALARFAWR
ncbi:MAG: HEAT repeat domain-containing protein [Vulcanimicrobiota bacterium]